MEIFYKNEFCQIEFDASVKVIFYKWYPTTIHINEEQFKECLLSYRDLFKELKYDKVLIDVSELLSPITVELQTWIDTEISLATVEAGLKKMALIASQNLLEQLSVELTLDEKNAQVIDVSYFEENKNALAWLLQ